MIHISQIVFVEGIMTNGYKQHGGKGGVGRVMFYE